MILVYEKDQGTLKSLRSFFKKRKYLKAEFIEDMTSLAARTSRIKGKNLICIIAAGELPKLKPRELNCSFIATVSGASRGVIRKALDYGAESYLITPLHEEDLEQKIRDVIKENQERQRMRKETHMLQTIIDISGHISSTLDPKEILYLIVSNISEIIPVTRCSIISVDGGQRYAHVISTFEDPHLTNIKLDLNKYPEIREALSSKKPVAIKNAAKDPIMKRVSEILFPLGIRSILVIPIIFHEEIIGTLFLRTSRARHAFTRHEINLCQAIANASANPLYNAYLFEKMGDEKSHLEKLAVTDYLTGLYNNRYFYYRLAEEYSRSVRHSFHLSCLMLDIDFFKEVNDRYGHKAGDNILKELAQLLKHHMRKSDVVARYGGEEFIILLPQTDANGALAKAESLRSHIENHPFRGLKGEKGLSVSIGLATHPDHRAPNKEDLITLADNALYTAKAMGRNQVVFSKP
ncbi:MAG TPA: sensor domain-containing diguanylate cyclase [Thermodesulfovibrionales bacterium]|nr:sensor domain-containing diguanylate cyclase [Thermodesulfovibrionales bacterium]